MTPPSTADPPASPAPPVAVAPARARRLDTDRIVAISAMVIGVCSLFITLYQTYLTRQAQSAQVLPYLVFAVTSTGEGAYITLRNDGVGPARVEDIRIHYQGRSTATDPYDFFIVQRPALNTGQINVDKVSPGRFVPAGATVQMLGVGAGDARVPMLKAMVQLFALADVPRSWLVALEAAGDDKAVIEVTYSSVYGDRWTVRSDRHVPQTR